MLPVIEIELYRTRSEVRRLYNLKTFLILDQLSIYSTPSPINQICALKHLFFFVGVRTGRNSPYINP